MGRTLRLTLPTQQLWNGGASGRATGTARLPINGNRFRHFWAGVSGVCLARPERVTSGGSEGERSGRPPALTDGVEQLVGRRVDDGLQAGSGLDRYEVCTRAKPVCDPLEQGGR